MKSIKEIFAGEEKCVLISMEQLTQLLKAEERLQIVKDYVANTIYLDKSTLLVLLGNSEKADTE